MKLQPIEKPKSLKLKLAYWMTKKQIGKVITPLKVVYSRKLAFLDFMQKLFKIDGQKLLIDDELKELVRYYTASHNHCTFCEDISRMRGLTRKIQSEKLNELANFKGSDLYTEGEKAALAYAAEMVLLNGVNDETFENLKRYFSEEAIIDITWVVSTELYMNAINRALDIGSDGLCEMPASSGQ